MRAAALGQAGDALAAPGLKDQGTVAMSQATVEILGRRL
jgi:hypothetical protein